MTTVPNWLTQKSSTSDTALIFLEQVWTFAELEKISLQTAENLTTIGLKNGNLVATLMDNHPNLVILIHALSKLGCIAIPLNTRLTSKEILWQIQDCHVDVLIYAQAQGEVVEKLNFWLSSPMKNFQSLRIEEVKGYHEDHPVPNNYHKTFVQNLEGNQGDIDLEAVQTVIYTSGTTGLPKGVQLTYGNHFYSAKASASHLKIVEGSDRWLNCLPLFHISGLSIVWRSVIWGIPMILQPKFDVGAICQAIADHQVTLISLVPTMLGRILASPDLQKTISYWQNLKGILLGGASTNPAIIAQCLALKLPILPTYGLTEAASQVATLSGQDIQRKLGSSGQALDCNRLRIVDEQGLELPRGEIGQILIRGANVMKGYLNHSSILFEDDWLPTGDLGYMDTEGYLYVINRRTDLIISGGENIYPSEIEAILLNHPDITDVCVVGVEDREWGQIVGCAIATTKAINLAEIREYCLSNHLARYKLPKVIHLVESLPRTPTGKLLRQKVCIPRSFDNYRL